MSQKTPVSVLQEFMMRRGHTPQYELVVDGTGTHDPIFKYKVSTPEIMAIGVGKSKKEAKHEAAKNALLRLEQSTPDPIVNVAVVESPYKDKTQENSVGMLMDLCAMRNLPPPEFELVNDEGPAHAKMFTMSCSVSKLHKIAIGRTKKQAKQLAAQKLFIKLRESFGGLPAEPVNTKSHIPDEELQKKLDLLVKSPFASNYKSCGHKLSEEIHLLNDLSCETLNKIRNNELKIDGSAVNLVESIANELNVDLSISLLPPYKNADEASHLAIIIMDLAIVVAQYGRGQTEDEAKQNAAASLITTLVLLSERNSLK